MTPFRPARRRSLRPSVLATAAASLALSLAPHAVHAQQSAPVTEPTTAPAPSTHSVPARLWHTNWRAVTTLETGLAGGVGVAAAVLAFAPIVNPPRNFSGPWLFDAPVRDALRASTVSGRNAASATSDALLAAFIGAPYAQAIVSAWVARDEPRTALYLATITTESYAVTGITMFLVKSLVGRERPNVTAARMQNGCDTSSPNDPTACQSHGNDNVSFFSGHSAFAFTSAGLLCSNGLYLGLGTHRWDIGLCAGAMAAAATTATLRVVADVHYASDILVGSFVGLLSGLLLPGIAHYRGTVIQEPPPLARGDRSYAPRNLMVLPMILPDGGGLAVAGSVL